MTRKFFIALIILIFVVGGAASIVFDRVIIPYLSTLPHLGSLKKLTTDSPIVINSRQEYQIDEDVNFPDLARQAQAFTVSIYSGDASTLAFAGNGIVLTSDGLIFTAKSVVGSLSSVTVVLNDGKSFPGVVRAMDPKSDLAVVTIQAESLGVAQFEDPWNVQAGQRVFALGKTSAEFTRVFNTGSITGTIAQNASLQLVNSTEQLGESLGTSIGFNSDYIGGPVLDIEGKVLGIVSNAAGKIVTSAGLNQALGSYLTSGKIARPYFGIQYLSLSKSLGQLRGFAQAGAVVVGIEANSPASLAGLKLNDYIVAVDNVTVSDNTFERLVNSRPVGPVKLKVMRGAETIEISFNVQLR